MRTESALAPVLVTIIAVGKLKMRKLPSLFINTLVKSNLRIIKYILFSCIPMNNNENSTQ
jgi:hypothetical protein